MTHVMELLRPRTGQISDLRRCVSLCMLQLSRMNYFHEVREKKERDAAARSAQTDGSSNGQVSSSDQQLHDAQACLSSYC